MIPRRYLELMHGELDGANTPAQSAELRSWLDDHPEGRAELETLRATGQLLARAAAEQAEPPAALRGRILGEVRSRAAAGARGRRLVPPPRRPAFPLFPLFPALRTAMVAGLGVAAGVLLTLALVSEGGLRGRPDAARGALLPGAVPGPAESFTLGTAHGNLRTGRAGGLIVADLELTVPAPTRAELSWTGPARLAGVVGLGAGAPSPAPAPAGLAATAGGLAFDATGTARCRVLLQATGAGPVALRLALPSGDGGRAEHAFAPR